MPDGSAPTTPKGACPVPRPQKDVVVTFESAHDADGAAETLITVRRLAAEIRAARAAEADGDPGGGSVPPGTRAPGQSLRAAPE
jgi:hypothetical protein